MWAARRTIVFAQKATRPFDCAKFRSCINGRQSCRTFRSLFVDSVTPAACGDKPEAERRCGAARSSAEGPLMEPEQRAALFCTLALAHWKREEAVGEVTRDGHARFWERAR